ncbi:conserved hypothetical protein [Trichinella spiralis]|uniref:hypothetical protein n=1 Tax=Trichinella spiralis TaxID=6334 RepID=UPI0001EFB76A|nr:conserved hypothetical protein [Trichinella spiralis]
MTGAGDEAGRPGDATAAPINLENKRRPPDVTCCMLFKHSPLTCLLIVVVVVVFIIIIIIIIIVMTTSTTTIMIMMMISRMRMVHCGSGCPLRTVVLLLRNLLGMFGRLRAASDPIHNNRAQPFTLSF